MLYLIATPIGNLKDLTFRALETLKSVDYILCEDTRTSGILLKHYEIQKPLISFHKFNEKKREEQVISDLREGKEIALISDAGTPGICDPGADLIQKCRSENLPITALPGPCALITTLSLFGEKEGPVQFLGFSPKKEGKLREILLQALFYPGISIWYESPRRLLSVLKALEKFPHQLFIARELTKLYEEHLSGTAQELLKHFEENPPRGELVCLLKGEKPEVNLSDLKGEVENLILQFDLSQKEAIKIVAEIHNHPKRELYNSMLD